MIDLRCIIPVPLILIGGLNLRAAEPGSGEHRAGLDWWSLQKVTRPELPAVKQPGWVRNGIDVFVLHKLESSGLRPAAEADRATLIRRLYFDLLGLPPTPSEIDEFVHDDHLDAYERLVDKLLASPHYGERWGRHWLDVARYCESQGFERDKLRDHAWRYRDYVIRSFNQDNPYPRFVAEQIAGDVLQPVTHDGIVATGFLVAGPWDEVGATQQSAVMRLRVREEELEDMLAAVGQTFLGLTVNCARCHDHKFDPIPQKDYYRLKAVFDGAVPGDRPLLSPGELRDREQRAAKLRECIADLSAQISALEKEGRDRVLARQGKPVLKGVPAPMARWTFEQDGRDAIGDLHGTLKGKAQIVNGRLKLDGKGSYLETGPLTRDLGEKTLEAWVLLSDLNQRGGGLISVESKGGQVFDAIVFGEREPKKWIAGSDGFVRTRDLAGPAEAAGPDELVHVAAVYESDGSITVYRNGTRLGEPYKPNGKPLVTFKAQEARILFGMRHTGGGNAFLTGEIEEGRLYDRALSEKEIAASFAAGVPRVSTEEIAAALTEEKRKQRQQLVSELASVRTELQETSTNEFGYCVNPRQPEPTFVLKRGDVEAKGQEVTAGGLSAIRTLPNDLGLKAGTPEGQRRLKFAEWLTAPDNPLTARVMVNRLWQHHFGRGIVGSPNDFGFNGERPSHPELLDWLATEFQARDWSIKEMHRLIVLSSAYRQSGKFQAAAAQVDADNKLLWRYAPQRLEGEIVRDAMLAISGQLRCRIHGPSYRPFTVQVFNSNFYELTDVLGPEHNRRTIYRINVNSARDPLLESLDCPDPSTKTPRRSITTTPLQALGMMNNPFIQRQAKAFAMRVKEEAGDSIAKQTNLAFLLALGREPAAEEHEHATSLVQEHGLEHLCWVLFNASEFLYVR
jgi:hypothetical protein